MKDKHLEEWLKNDNKKNEERLIRLRKKIQVYKESKDALDEAEPSVYDRFLENYRKETYKAHDPMIDTEENEETKPAEEDEDEGLEPEAIPYYFQKLKEKLAENKDKINPIDRIRKFFK